MGSQTLYYGGTHKFSKPILWGTHVSSRPIIWGYPWVLKSYTMGVPIGP
jgi:hypothetical protein